MSSNDIDLSFLPFAAKNYKISSDVNDYMIFSTLICPSGLPNRNGIAFPLEELVKFTGTPNPHFVYKGWVGCPVHLEHDNEDSKTAIGVVFDVSLKRSAFYSDNKPIYNVIGVLGIDKTKAPQIAKQFARGDIRTVSMGALCEYATCSICGCVCTQDNHCIHTKGGVEALNFKTFENDNGEIELAFLNAHNLDPIEVSIVKDPAWAPAISDLILKT